MKSGELDKVDKALERSRKDLVNYSRSGWCNSSNMDAIETNFLLQ